MSSWRLRVVIAGGGVAALETLMGLHSLAADRVDLTLIAPQDEFVFRPLAAQEPYPVAHLRTLPLDRAARDAGARFIPATIQAADPVTRSVTLHDRHPIGYDALVLAIGAEAMPAVEHALTWDDRSDSDAMGGLLRDIEDGYCRSVAVVIPPGPGWPLRGYELALLIAADARDLGAAVTVTLVTPDPSPLEPLGRHAVDRVARELESARVAVVAGTHADVLPGHPATVVVQPSGRRIEADRILALPALHGRRIEGFPADAAGFVETDDHCRVVGVSDVWAAGDATASPVRSGAIAAAQADAAAEDIAAVAGAPVEPRPFDTTPRPELGGPPSGRFLAAWLGLEQDGLRLQLPAGTVPVLTYLRRDLAAGWRGYG